MLRIAGTPDPLIVSARSYDTISGHNKGHKTAETWVMKRTGEVRIWRLAEVHADEEGVSYREVSVHLDRADRSPLMTRRGHWHSLEYRR